MATWNLKKQANAENIPALFSKCKKTPIKIRLKFLRQRRGGGNKSDRKPMPNGVKENQKAFSEGIKSNGDLVLLEN